MSDANDALQDKIVHFWLRKHEGLDPHSQEATEVWEHAIECAEACSLWYVRRPAGLPKPAFLIRVETRTADGQIWGRRHYRTREIGSLRRWDDGLKGT